jgi:hypothetical protein
MGPDDRRVDEHGLQVRLIDTPGMDFIPDPLVTPAREPLEYGVPVGMRFGEQTPLRATTQNPHDGVQKRQATRFIAHSHLWEGLQNLMNYLPWYAAEFVSVCHGKKREGLHRRLSYVNRT